MCCERNTFSTNTDKHRLFGFLLGTVGAGGALYYYVVDQYKVSNEMLTEDIYVRLTYDVRCKEKMVLTFSPGTAISRTTTRGIREEPGSRDTKEEVKSELS